MLPTLNLGHQYRKAIGKLAIRVIIENEKSLTRPTPSAAMEVKGAMKGITAAGIRFWTLKVSPFMV